MGATTFSGPVKSLGGFISAGSDNDINITSDDTLTVQGFAGRLLRVNDADCKITNVRGRIVSCARTSTVRQASLFLCRSYV